MTSRSSLGPLNAGNVVTTSFMLLKSNFATFFKLAGIAYLWIFVPVYGWAKFSMYQGLLARLAFGQLINQPETVEEARTTIQDRLWNFWIVGLLIWLITSGVFLGFFVILLIGGLIVGVAGAALGTVGAIISGLFTFVGLIGALFGFAWISGRLFCSEMPIALGPDSGDPTAAIGKSWRLTQAYGIRIMVIVFIAGVLTFPLTFLVQLVAQVPVLVLPEGSLLAGLMLLLSYVLSFAAAMITLPFWQCVKAVTFYDLRARREGLDIQLRDRPI